MKLYCHLESYDYTKVLKIAEDDAKRLTLGSILAAFTEAFNAKYSKCISSNQLLAYTDRQKLLVPNVRIDKVLVDGADVFIVLQADTGAASVLDDVHAATHDGISVCAQQASLAPRQPGSHVVVPSSSSALAIVAVASDASTGASTVDAIPMQSNDPTVVAPANSGSNATAPYSTQGQANRSGDNAAGPSSSAQASASVSASMSSAEGPAHVSIWMHAVHAHASEAVAAKDLRAAVDAYEKVWGLCVSVIRSDARQPGACLFFGYKVACTVGHWIYAYREGARELDEVYVNGPQNAGVSIANGYSCLNH